jgi:hypothetical protein
MAPGWIRMICALILKFCNIRMKICAVILNQRMRSIQSIRWATMGSSEMKASEHRILTWINKMFQIIKTQGGPIGFTGVNLKTILLRMWMFTEWMSKLFNWTKILKLGWTFKTKVRTSGGSNNALSRSSMLKICISKLAN